jgi:hypothetical protein
MLRCADVCGDAAEMDLKRVMSSRSRTPGPPVPWSERRSAFRTSAGKSTSLPEPQTLNSPSPPYRSPSTPIYSPAPSAPNLRERPP